MLEGCTPLHGQCSCIYTEETTYFSYACKHAGLPCFRTSFQLIITTRIDAYLCALATPMLSMPY